MVWCLALFFLLFTFIYPHCLHCSFQLSPFPVIVLVVFLAFPQIGSGIGRMILKEEMKARSGSYDNDPWGSARNSRSGSKETLNTTGYGSTVYNHTVNGCKHPPCLLKTAFHFN